MPLASLPIDAVLPKVIDAVSRQSVAVLRAPTGSGKTTRVPPALLDAGLAGGSGIVMLEPRRVAARAAARRIAFERGGRVGGEVGYVVRFDQNIGPDTKIKIVTDGVLLRMLQDDPFLEQAAIVIFDEFHERGLNADLALAMVRRLQQTVRPELKIIVMSATLAFDRIAEFLGNCAVIEGQGQLFPVELRYQPQEDPRHVTERAAAAVQQIVAERTGDILVFLPGIGEIRRTAERLSDFAARHDLAVMELYGDLSAEQQDAVLGRIGRRKVVLATNVAETSITIEGITAVVDTGLARVLRYDPSVGLDRLVLSKISRSSADQRAGRAGRTQSGVCLRLWTERDHLARPESELPEVRRVDLSGPILQLMSWGEPDARQFPWFEAPEPPSIDQAAQLLTRLDAMRDRRLTSVGLAMVQVPVHPRLARLLIEAKRGDVLAEGAMIAALLSERDPFLRDRVIGGQSRVRANVRRSASDLLDRLRAMEDFERTGRTDSGLGRISASAARYTLRVRDQLIKAIQQEKIARPQTAEIEFRTSSDNALLRAIFAAFPDRLARRREPGSRRAVMTGGHGVRLADSSAVMEPELFVCVDVAADKSESHVRLASAVEHAWLASDRLVTEVRILFDHAEERVAAIRCTTWDGLILDEAPCNLPDEEQVAALLATAAAQNLDRVLALDDRDLANLLARVRCLGQWMPQLELPVFDNEQLRQLLPELCLGRRSFAELRKAPWVDFLKSKLTARQLQGLDREAPERLVVPSGSRIALDYEVGRPPVLAVRIQELFGLSVTPRIAGGRVPVLLHLLAPNMRPQQVTDDIESFWTNTYPKIRSELRRRYPKHAWPEDPRTADAQRRPTKRK